MLFLDLLFGGSPQALKPTEKLTYAGPGRHYVLYDSV